MMIRCCQKTRSGKDPCLSRTSEQQLATCAHVDAASACISKMERSDTLTVTSTLDPPHTSTNFVQDEMGFRVARKHARKFQRLALMCGLAALILLLLVMLTSAGSRLATTGGLTIASIILMLGLLIER